MDPATARNIMPAMAKNAEKASSLRGELTYD